MDLKPFGKHTGAQCPIYGSFLIHNYNKKTTTKTLIELTIANEFSVHFTVIEVNIL